MGIGESVDISITSATKTVSRVGFGTALILSPNANFAGRTQEFETAGEALAEALCGGDESLEYNASAALFSQDTPPDVVKLGHVGGTKTITDDEGTFTDGTVTGKVNGHDFTSGTYEADKDTALENLAAAIEAADTVNVDSAVYNAGAHTIVVTPKTGKTVAITALVLTLGEYDTMTMEVSATRTEDLDDALSVIVLSDDDFYGVVECGRVQDDQEAIAAWVKAYTGSPKICGIASANATIIDSTVADDTTTIAAVLKNLSNSRTFVMFGENASISVATPQYNDAALFGNILPRDPGRWTACYKNLVSCTPDPLTPTQSTNARAKNANTYENIGGASVVRWGTMASGDFIDYIVFKDWLTSRLSEAIYSLLVNSAKVPYDHNGFAAIESAMNGVFKDGQVKDANGIQAITEYSEDSTKKQNGGYWIEFPKMEDISASDKTARFLQNVKFAVWYTNGIHTVKITGAIVL